MFQLVEHGDGKVLDRDAAMSIGVGQQLIAAEAELAGSFPLAQVGRGRQKGPVQLRLPAQLLERVDRGQGARADGGGEIRVIHDADAGFDLQAAGALTHRTRLSPASLTARMIEAVPRTWSSYRAGFFHPGLKALISASCPVICAAKRFVS